MTSTRRIEASRLNGRKSCGPRSAAGRSIASRNALRHGLAAISHRPPVPASDIDGFAKALCGTDDDPSLFAEALTIAKNQLVLRAVVAQQLALVERVRDSMAQALAKGDNSLKLATARSQKCYDAYDEIIGLRDKLLEKYKDRLPPPVFTKEEEDTLMSQIDHLVLIPPHLEELLVEQESETIAEALKQNGTRFQDEELPRERDESTAMEEAASDLIRLDRYERRAWSRQKRAIRAFTNIKLMKRLSLESSTAP